MCRTPSTPDTATVFDGLGDLRFQSSAGAAPIALYGDREQRDIGARQPVTAQLGKADPSEHQEKSKTRWQAEDYGSTMPRYSSPSAYPRSIEFLGKTSSDWCCACSEEGASVGHDVSPTSRPSGFP